MTVFVYWICPKCKSDRTFWRRGVHFDHERMCECGHVYDPQEEANKLKEDRRED